MPQPGGQRNKNRKNPDRIPRHKDRDKCEPKMFEDHHIVLLRSITSGPMIPPEITVRTPSSTVQPGSRISDSLTITTKPLVGFGTVGKKTLKYFSCGLCLSRIVPVTNPMLQTPDRFIST